MKHISEIIPEAIKNKTMSNRNQIEEAISTKRNQILSLRDDIVNLKREAILLSDDEQQYTEQVEEFTQRVDRKKVKVKKLIGRIHWKEEIEDGDTGEKFTIERSQPVKIDGEWIV